MGLLEGKTAVVTGASSGIGRAIALRFAREGASVVVADVREEPIEGGPATSRLIVEEGGSGAFELLDVSCPDSVDAVVANVCAAHGRLDVMVNNAAIYTSTGLLDTTPEQWRRVMSVNVDGVFFGCRSAVRQMLKQEPVGEARGRIINIASQHGMIACPGDPAYAVSKAAVAQMTRQIAVDHARDLIVCNAIAPGKILTGRTDIGIDPAALSYARSRTPWPRLGRPDDIASFAAFLASDMATYVTGASVLIDGGWMAG